VDWPSEEAFDSQGVKRSYEQFLDEKSKALKGVQKSVYRRLEDLRVFQQV